MSFYGRPDYWDQRYLSTQNKPPCEWYRNYGSLRHLLNPIYFATKGTATKMKREDQTPQAPSNQTLALSTPVVDTGTSQSNSVAPDLTSFPSTTKVTVAVSSFPARDKCRILILGCGNSTFGEDMIRDGWTGPITNVDFSQIVVDQMNEKYDDSFYQALPKSRQPTKRMEFLCADITKPLAFEDESFDLVVSKGSFDAVLCSSKCSIRGLVQDVVRVLAHGHGVFFLVTHGNPDNRLEFLEYKNELNHYWDGVSVHVVSSNGHHHKNPHAALSDRTVYVYICRKRLDIAASVDKENNDIAKPNDSAS